MLFRLTLFSCLLALLSCVKKTIPPEPTTAQIACIEAAGTDSIESQFYLLSSNQTSYITGNQGTFIKVPKGAFVLPDGSSHRGEIHLELKEANSLQSLVKGRISTLAGNRLLSTAGTAYIGAKADGQDLKARTGKYLTVAFPGINKNSNTPVLRTARIAAARHGPGLRSERTRMILPIPPKLKKPEGHELLGELRELRMIKQVLHQV